MKRLTFLFFILLTFAHCKARENNSATKTSDEIVTEEEVASYWIRFLNDPASFFPDMIHISDDIKISKSQITDYTVEYGSDRYKYSQIASRPAFLMLDNGEVLSMFCEGQNTAREPFIGGSWDGELIYRMKSFMAPRLFEVRRFLPLDSRSARVTDIVANWKSFTTQGKEFVYRAFSDSRQEKFVIQLVGRLEAKARTPHDMFYSVSDSNLDRLLDQTIAKQLNVDTYQAQKMFEARMLKNVSSDKRTHAIGFKQYSDDLYWQPLR